MTIVEGGGSHVLAEPEAVERRTDDRYTLGFDFHLERPSMFASHRSAAADWPEIDFSTGAETAATLHMYAQIVGKIRLVQSPWVNHSWHVPLYVSMRGLTTTPIPYRGRAFEMELDFHDQVLVIRCVTGRVETVPLGARFPREHLRRGRRRRRLATA